VFDIPFEEAYAMLKRKEKPPEHLANSLYLEWFSETNGRVVVESADYELTISAPQWQLTPEENEQRARDVAGAMDNFMARRQTPSSNTSADGKIRKSRGTNMITSISSKKVMPALRNTASCSISTAIPMKPKQRSPKKWAGNAN
jgi:hypothetical protein